MASATQLSLGQWVSVRSQEGRVRYVGPTGFAEGEWVGIELASAVGRNDGSVRGVRYFSCKPRHGLFVQRAQCVPIEGPSKEGDEPAGDVASAWAAIEMVDEGAALQAGRDSQRVLQHLSQTYPQGAPAAVATSPKHPPLKKKDSLGQSSMRAGRAHVRPSLIDSGDEGYGSVLAELQMPSWYTGPLFESTPTEGDIAELLQLIKQRVAYPDASMPQAAVPQKVAMRILLQTKKYLLSSVNNLVDMKLSEGRLIIVGDTHGQLADFCWLLRSHGLPAKDNIYLINGDVADRGQNAVEILLLVFGYMLAMPGCMYINRGNHESLDMNVRGFHEGGGFAVEVGSKYDSATFTLFQDVFNLLPLATRVNSEVLVLHGGLSRTNSATLAQISAINRRRAVPVAPTNAEDTLFFDLMWADPRAADGVGLSAVRGAGCCTFGPDVTRRFCEINRLRMVIRSHEVPKSLSGVQVQHAGRLVTIFSASNYCGRIGNTGGTMLLTPQLDYQLMEHWAPSVADLLQMEAEEAGARTPTPVEKPSEARESFKNQANSLMRADVLQKMKELVAEHKFDLAAYYDSHVDSAGSGVHSGAETISQETWLAGLRDVIQAPLPWEEYVQELLDDTALEESGAIRYRPFLARYRVTHEDTSWQSDLLGSLLGVLTKKDLGGTLAFFDVNQDGVVTFDELFTVLSRFALGMPDTSLRQLATQLLNGKAELSTASLLARLQVAYRDVAAAESGATPEVRKPPEWAQQLLNTVARQCALRKRDSEQLFRSFDSNGDGVISYSEFQSAMVQLGGYEVANLSPDQKASIEQMLLDLAAWVDQKGSGTIKYMDFIDAFQILDDVEHSVRGGPEAGDEVSSAQEALGLGAVSQLMEQLCSLFFQHRWSMQRAFEYFDANGDGSLTPEEFRTALTALSEMPKGTVDGFRLEFTDEQINHLIDALDRDGNGVIDYDEFLQALETSDAMEQ